MPHLVGEKDRMRKASMGKTKVSVRKTNRFLGEQTGQKGCDKICLCRCERPFHHLHGYGTPLEQGFMIGLLLLDPPLRGSVWQPHFQEVDAFSPIRETVSSFIPASVESQMSST